MTRDELVELMARAIHTLRRERGFAQALWEYEPHEIHSLYREMGAAALTELEKRAVVVPAEPTAEMQRAGYYDVNHSIEGVGDLAPPPEEQPRLIYLAMLAARPR